jgi:hypothetical protein
VVFNAVFAFARLGVYMAGALITTQAISPITNYLADFTQYSG